MAKKFSQQFYGKWFETQKWAESKIYLSECINIVICLSKDEFYTKEIKNRKMHKTLEIEFNSNIHLLFS